MKVESLARANFTPEEFFKSETACERNISNYTTEPAVLANLNIVASKMQEIRNLLGEPIKINSAYRCLDLNRAVGSKDTSQHVLGQACDFVCPNYGTPEQIVDCLIKNDIEVDQCLMEGTWVHLSVMKSNRNQYASLINGEFKLLK